MAQAVADVLNEILNVVHPAHIPALLFDLLDTTQLTQGSITSLLRRHSSCRAFPCQLFQVEAEFLGEFLVDIVLTEE